MAGALHAGAPALRRVRARVATVGGGIEEALVMAAAYGLYSLVKGLWGGSLAEGRRNAADVVELERALGIHWEEAWQRFVETHGLGMPLWSAFYLVSQVVALPLTLLLAYRYRREGYAFLRNMALLSWTAGVVWYALQPVAPPRLTDGAIRDTVTDGTPVDLGSDFVLAFYNPVAAMPSLHVGMAPVVAWALWRLTPRRLTRALGLAYPALVVVAIVVTGNHWLLDVAGGLTVVLPAAAIAAWAVRASPAALAPGVPGGRR